MALPGNDAVARFQENEERFDQFLNTNGYYLDKNNDPVETIPHLTNSLASMTLNIVNKGSWLTSTVYNRNDLVKIGGTNYICVSAHTAGTFSTDFSNGKWNVYLNALKSDFDSISAAAQTQVLLGKLSRNLENASVLVLGDSTGNDTEEWVYLMGQGLALLFPAYTIKYSLWNGSSYPTPSTIATGTGTNILTIYNGSIAGSITTLPLGANFPGMVESTKPDLVFISYGHNEFAWTWGQWSSSYLMLTEAVSLSCAYAGIICILQNPTSNNNYQGMRATVYQKIAATMGYGVIDIHQVFLDYGDWSTLLIDSVHPNSTGSQLWANEVLKAFVYNRTIQPVKRNPSLSMAGTQLIENGDFTKWDEVSTHAPNNWTVGGTITFANETNNDDAPEFKYPLKLTATAGAPAFISQDLPFNKVKGKWVTAVARIYIPAGQGARVGRIAIGTDLLNDRDDDQTTNSYGGWVYRIIQTYIAPNASYARFWLWVDLTTGGGNCSVDFVSIVIGDVPMGIYKPNFYSSLIKVAGKNFTANGSSATFVYPARKTYQVISTTAAALTITLPATSSDIDGLVIGIVNISNGASITWAAGTGGASIVGGPSGFTANIPIRMIYLHDKLAWYPF